MSRESAYNKLFNNNLIDKTPQYTTIQIAFGGPPTMIFNNLIPFKSSSKSDYNYNNSKFSHDEITQLSKDWLNSVYNLPVKNKWFDMWDNYFQFTYMEKYDAGYFEPMFYNIANTLNAKYKDEWNSIILKYNELRFLEIKTKIKKTIDDDTTTSKTNTSTTTYGQDKTTNAYGSQEIEEEHGAINSTSEYGATSGSISYGEQTNTNNFGAQTMTTNKTQEKDDTLEVNLFNVNSKRSTHNDVDIDSNTTQQVGTHTDTNMLGTHIDTTTNATHTDTSIIGTYIDTTTKGSHTDTLTRDIHIDNMNGNENGSVANDRVEECDCPEITMKMIEEKYKGLVKNEIMKSVLRIMTNEFIAKTIPYNYGELDM